MGRSPCCSKEGMNKGAWTADEDKILKDFIKIHGEGRWRNLPKRAGLMRCGKSCRLRWLNYLKPDIKRGNISPDEEELIIRLHKLLGNRWSLIAGRLPGRTDNEIKNYWNTNLCKKVEKNKSKSNIKEPQPKEESSHVVRTRAVKCSKGFITPQPNEKADPTANNTFVVAEPMDKFIPAEEDNPRDLGLDVDMGDVWLSEFLDSEWMGYCRSNSSIELSGDMLEDWSGNGFLQGNSNQNDLASFLEYGSDWLPN